MKPVIRISRTLKIIGIVLILLSLVLGLYTVLNTRDGWKKINEGMNLFGEKTGFFDKLAFDDQFLTGLSKMAAIPAADKKDEAAAEKVKTERKEAARPVFTSLFSKIENAQENYEKRIQEEAVRFLTEDLDAQKYVDWCEEIREERLEHQTLQPIYDYIDNLALAGKSGKGPKNAKKPDSKKPVLEKFYRDFLAENGGDEEKTGTWFEFMVTLQAMLKAEEANGNAVRNIDNWLKEFSPETYQTALADTRNNLEGKDAEESFGSELEEAMRRKLNGQDPDFDGILERTAAKLDAIDSNQNVGGKFSTKTALSASMPEIAMSTELGSHYSTLAEYLRKGGSGFILTSAGIYSATGGETIEFDAVKQYPVRFGDQIYVIERKDMLANNAAGVEDDFLDLCIDETENRSDISFISSFWAVTAKYATLMIIGILLVILSRVIRWLLFRWLLAKRDTAGIQEDSDILLRVEHLKQYFRSGPAVTKAVDDISFFIRKGEVFGLVGESGCGKTTTGRTIINLYDPTEGNVYFDGLKISSMLNGLPVLTQEIRNEYFVKIREAKQAGDQAELRRLKAEQKAKLNEAERNAWESYVEKSKCVQFYREKRLAQLKEAYDRDMAQLSGEAAEERTRKYRTECKVAKKDNMMARMQMIFQDPIASINPRMTVREIIAEGLIIRGVRDKKYINEKVYEMLELVGLVREHADRYPHEFSGGQRQRIGIARAIIMEPDLIIADEPISALDVSIQAQVINLLNDLRNRMGLTIMFIAHNLSVVKYFSDRIAVMYFGHIVELATSDELFAHPLHPYTKSLLSAIPYPDPHYEKTRKRIEYVPAKAHDYSVDKPELREIVPGHYIHCNEAEYQQYLKEIEQ